VFIGVKGYFRMNNLLASLKKSRILSCGKGTSSVWKLNG
jgi:hypothetical protein